MVLSRNAMDNAQKNASDMISSLQMKYNRGRQAAITNELVDIITGSFRIITYKVSWLRFCIQALLPFENLGRQVCLWGVTYYLEWKTCSHN